MAETVDNVLGFIEDEDATTLGTEDGSISSFGKELNAFEEGSFCNGAEGVVTHSVFLGGGRVKYGINCGLLLGSYCPLSACEGMLCPLFEGPGRPNSSIVGVAFDVTGVLSEKFVVGWGFRGFEININDFFGFGEIGFFLISTSVDCVIQMQSSKSLPRDIRRGCIPEDCGPKFVESIANSAFGTEEVFVDR